MTSENRCKNVVHVFIEQIPDGSSSSSKSSNNKNNNNNNNSLCKSLLLYKSA